MSPSLLLTRPEADSRRFLAAVEGALGRPVEAVISPLLRIVPLTPPLPQGVAGVVVTSANGAAALARLGVDRQRPIWAVGDRTAQVAAEDGYAARSAGGDADALVALLLHERPPGPLLHLRGADSRGAVARRLAEGGLRCEEAVCYRQEAQPLSADATARLAAPGPVVAPVFSPRTGTLLAAQGPFAAALTLVCLSAAVAAEVHTLSAAVVTAARPDLDAMVTGTVLALSP
ncbi:uroporphyrinogen-III synthase [Wenxinia marina]|uniref:Uroporphyrinogen-III synthase n=1 Tax=Wenxinia marina DSM 24838 TaxID=1123501 RepID=A0A0D0NS95_9RHOB|nr:uroporphyrinogen-III synthase [Wenxinia marina]KIQ71100.1 Uroporphyrinogen-III synthase [Wenxinia marina DSM 24838]GGL54839.1 uroporphyrinogen III methyltransferase [Wenxinia marina]